MVRFYPTLQIFVIQFPDANLSVDYVLRNEVVRFLDDYGALTLNPIHLQASERFTVQDALYLPCDDEVEVLVFAHHPLLELFLLRRGRDDPVHFIDQGLLIHRDLETADLNEPHRECIFDLFQDLLSPPFGERGHTTLTLCNIPLQLPGRD